MRECCASISCDSWCQHAIYCALDQFSVTTYLCLRVLMVQQVYTYPQSAPQRLRMIVFIPKPTFIGSDLVWRRRIIVLVI